MHAQLNFRQIPDGQIDEAIRIYRDSTLPEVRTHRGFKGSLILADRNAGRIIALGLFETEADLRARTRTTFVDPIAGEPTIERYEVSAYDRPESEAGKSTHARVNTRQIQDGKMDEAIKTYQDSTVPRVRGQRGSTGALVLTDRGTGKVVAISLWASEGDMNAAAPSSHVDDISVGPPTRETYEVSAEI